MLLLHKLIFTTFLNTYFFNVTIIAYSNLAQSKIVNVVNNIYRGAVHVVVNRGAHTTYLRVQKRIGNT